MNINESDLDKTLAFLQSEEFDKLIAATKEFWDECDYMGMWSNGAPERELGKLTKRFNKLYSIPAPEGYAAFLRKLNGFKYGEFEIYPCKAAITASKKEKHNPYFIFGCDGEKILSYDHYDKLYAVRQIDHSYSYSHSETDERRRGHDKKGRPVWVKERDVDRVAYKTVETYDTFAEMFKTIMMYTLPSDKLHKVYPALKGWT